MTSTAKRAEQTNCDRMHEIEGKHFGRCIDQLWGAGRRSLVELMDYPKARCQVVVVKQYDSPVPKAGAREWPELIATYVYVPIGDKENTWDSLDKALRKFELDSVPAVTNLSLSEVGI